MQESLSILLSHLEFIRQESKLLPCHPHSQYPTCTPPNVYDMLRQVERKKHPLCPLLRMYKSLENLPVSLFSQVRDESTSFPQCEPGTPTNEDHMPWFAETRPTHSHMDMWLTHDKKEVRSWGRSAGHSVGGSTPHSYIQGPHTGL